jgi:hypothetical protein
MTSKKQHAQESIEALRELLKPGDTVWTKVDHVARSGMSRRISLYVAVNSEIRNITWHVARAMGDPVKQRDGYVQDVGLWVSGCGMDMCFNTVYNLGRVLFPDGFGVACHCEGTTEKVRPESREEATAMVDGLKHKFRGRNGDTSGWDNDGGYALNKRDL